MPNCDVVLFQWILVGIWGVWLLILPANHTAVPERILLALAFFVGFLAGAMRYFL